jgi:hypothetical protein
MSGRNTLSTTTPPRKKHGVVVSELVTELLGILDISAPEPDADSTPEVVEGKPDLQQETDRLLNGVKSLLGGAYKSNPPGATTAEGAALDSARSKLQKLCDALQQKSLQVRRNDHMPNLKEAATEIGTAYREVTQAIDKREQRRQGIRTAVANLFGGKLEGATGKENADLVDKSKKVLDFLEKDTRQDDLTAVGKAFDVLDKALPTFAGFVEKYTKAVAGRQKDKEETLRLAADVETPEGAAPDALDLLRKAVGSALAKSPLDDPDVAAGRLALDNLTKERDRLEGQLAPLRSRYSAALSQLAAIEAKAGFTKDLKKTTGEAVGVAMTECRAILVPPKLPLNEGVLDKFGTKLFNLRGMIVDTIAQNYSNQGAVGGMRSYIEEEARRLNNEAKTLPSLDLDDLKKLKANAAVYYVKITDIFKKKLGGAAVSESRSYLQDLLATVEELRNKVGPAALKLAETATQTKESVDRVNIDDFADKYNKRLSQIRAAIGKIVEGTLTATEVGRATSMADQFRALQAEAEADLKAEKAVKQHQTQLKSTFSGVKDAAIDVAKVELQRLLDRAAQLASQTGDARDMIGAATLYEKLSKRLEAVRKDKPVPDGSFAAITVDGHVVSDETRKAVQSLCSKAVFDKLEDKQRASLCAAVEKDGPQLKVLLEEGLGGDVGVAAALFQHCDAKALSALARAFAASGAKTSRENLCNLIEEGGLAEHPRALSAMLNQGVDTAGRDGRTETADQVREGNATAIKALGDAFTDKASRAAMVRLLGECGLGSGPGDAAPPAIGSLLRDGCQGDPQALLAFGKEFEGTDKKAATERANLKKLINKGGIGEHPSVFGPLVHRASDKKKGNLKSGASKIKQIGEAFATDEDAAKLKQMLDAGGMSGDITRPGKENEHPDTLGKIFQHGMEGDADKLKRFVLAFAGHEAECKQMLDGFNTVADQYAAFRQPGQKIKMLLDGPFNGKIDSLQKVFTTNLSQIGTAQRRNQAFRFAPHVANGSEKPAKGAFGAGISDITASVEGRHKPETFEKSRMKAEAPNSLFPPNQDVGALLTKTMTALGQNVDKSASRQTTISVTAASFGFGESDEAGYGATDTIQVEVGFLNDTTVNHFGPRGDKVNTPFETPPFSTAEMGHLLAGLGK